MATPLGKPSDKADRPESAPDSVSRSVVREGAQAGARNTVKQGAHAAAPAPQASLTVSRQPLPRRPVDPLRSSPNRAAAQLALRAQTVLADCPRFVCGTRRLRRE